jgi:general stress protein YciG
MTNKKLKRERLSHEGDTPRGFAALTPEQRREIASKGGRAAQRKGKAHRWTAEEAAEAGRKGGLASQATGAGYRFDSLSGAKAAKKRRRR